VVRPSDGSIPKIYSTGLEDLLPYPKPNQPTKGFRYLVRQLLASPYSLGYEAEMMIEQMTDGKAVPLGDVLGKGSSSYVFAVIYEGLEVVIKVLRHDSDMDLENERNILTSLDGCANIPTILSVSTSKVIVLQTRGKPLSYLMSENNGRLGNIS
jgi:hypothetical protein